MHQHYVIATSTKLDIAKVAVPENIDDVYFRRIRERRAKKAEGDIFAAKKKVNDLNNWIWHFIHSLNLNIV